MAPTSAEAKPTATARAARSEGGGPRWLLWGLQGWRMGKNNRARRAAKEKQRKSGQRFSHRPAGDAGFGFTDRELAAGLLDLAAGRMLRSDDLARTAAIARLAELAERTVDAEIEQLLRSTLALLWDNGWQPSEIVRQVRRASTAAAGRLAASLIVADHVGRSQQTLDPAWAAQLSVLRTDAPPQASTLAASWFAAWTHHEAFERSECLTHAVAVLAALYGVGPLAELIPPPGRGPRRAGPHAGARMDDPILARVRALLAQAESTTFPAEAETFTAKAHELITRHAIDQAMLEAGNPDEQPTSRRIGLDDPYVDAKSYLLQVVAEHNRCRSVFDTRYALSTVVGFRTDLDAAEMLFTSLLIQVQVALNGEARNAPAGSRIRGRSFRSSFLIAYTHRIGERLAQVNRVVLETVEAETHRSALPVLAARRSEVDETMNRIFGPTIEHSPVKTRWDGYGAMRGRLAGDQAQLTFGDLAEATAS